MSADFTPEKEDLKILTPFKMQVLTNFPYIEADFDALTNYQLLCKVVEYLNNVIAETNEVTEQTLSLYNAYVALQNYVNTEISTFEDTVNNTVQSLEDYMNDYFDNLDVQEEINNKLDEMALDGTLTNLIKDYVDPIYQAYETEINGLISEQNTEISNFKSTVNAEIGVIDNKVSSAVSGTPKGVYSTVSSLTSADPDHQYIYVVSADGHWYYYNTSTSSWTDGGVYQAAEDSTTVSDLSTNAFQYRGLIESGTLADRYEIGYFYTTSDYTASDIPEANEQGMLLNYWSSNSYRRYQMFITYHDNIYLRNYRGGSYSAWYKYAYDDIKNAFQNRNAIVSGLCSEIGNQGTYFITTDYIPSDWISSTEGGMLLSYYTSDSYRNYQIGVLYSTKEVYIRHKKGGSWSLWTLLNHDQHVNYAPNDKFVVQVGKTTYNISLYTNQYTNVNIWRITDIIYGDTAITDYTTDVEGPIKELNAPDFIGGVHGDEQLTDIKVVCDGSVINLATDTISKSFKCLSFYIKSNVYHANTNNIGFERNKIITFKNNKCYISNHWKVVNSAATVVRATGGGLVSVNDTNINGIELNSTFSYVPLASIGVNDFASKNLTEITFKNDFGTVIIENIIGKELPYYNGFITHFTQEAVPRVKGYLCVIDKNDGLVLNVNDTIRSEFTIELI